MGPPPAADDATIPTAFAAATLADSFSPNVAMDTADGATATAASAADTGVEVHTDPVPTATAPPTNEHISSFLLHTRRRAAGNAAPSSPDVTGGPTDGATATATSAARKPPMVRHWVLAECAASFNNKRANTGSRNEFAFNCDLCNPNRPRLGDRRARE